MVGRVFARRSHEFRGVGDSWMSPGGLEASRDPGALLAELSLVPASCNAPARDPCNAGWVAVRCLIVDDNRRFLRGGSNAPRARRAHDFGGRDDERGRAATGCDASAGCRARRCLTRGRERLRARAAPRRRSRPWSGDPDLHSLRGRARRRDRAEPGGWLPCEVGAVGGGDPRSCSTELARVEVGDHGEHAAVIVLPLRQAQLPEDAVHVLLDGSFGHPELPCDSGV